MQLIIYILILLATVEFNKQLIDNVFADAKEQREWHTAQLVQWVVIYTGIAFIGRDFLTLICFGMIYPMTYDTLLNLRRGEKWNHKGKHDLPDIVKFSLIIIGIILIVKD